MTLTQFLAVAVPLYVLLGSVTFIWLRAQLDDHLPSVLRALLVCWIVWPVLVFGAAVVDMTPRTKSVLAIAAAVVLLAVLWASCEVMVVLLGMPERYTP